MKPDPAHVELLAFAWKIASEELRESGQVMPTAFVVSGRSRGFAPGAKDRVTVIKMPFRDEKEKALCLAGLRTMVKQENASMVAYVLETWKKRKEDSGRIIEPHEALAEMLFVSLYTLDFSWQGWSELVRDEFGQPSVSAVLPTLHPSSLTDQYETSLYPFERPRRQG